MIIAAASRSPAASAFYCDQHHAGLDPRLTVYETIARASDLSRTQIHYLLAKLLFTGDAVHKPVAALSRPHSPMGMSAVVVLVSVR